MTRIINYSVNSFNDRSKKRDMIGVVCAFLGRQGRKLNGDNLSVATFRPLLAEYALIVYVISIP